MKRNSFTRTLGILLSLLLLLGAMPLATLPVFAQNVTGWIYASGVRAGEDVVLWGDTILVMDEDLTVPSIHGDYNLTIEGSGRLTVNGGGNGIAVKSLYCTSDLFIQTGWHAIEAAETVYISNTESFIVGGIYATGNIDIQCYNATIAGNGNAIASTLGSITLSGGIFDIGANGVAVQADVGSIYMTGNFTVNSNESHAIMTGDGTVEVNGSLKVTSGEMLESVGALLIAGISARNGFTFSGTTLDIKAWDGICVFNGDISIFAESTKIRAYNDYGIMSLDKNGDGVGGYIYIDSDYLDLQTTQNIGACIDASGTVTIYSEEARFIGYYGIRADGDIFLDGNFVVKGLAQSALYSDSRIEARGNLSASTDGIEYCISTQEFIFDGTALTANGHAGIWGGLTQINADSVVLTTKAGTALGGDEVYVIANYLWAENKATEWHTEWQERGGSQHGIKGRSRISLVVKNGTVIGYENGLHVYDDLDKFDVHYIHVDGSLTIVSRTGAGMYAPEGIIDLNGGPIVSVGETHGIDGKEVYFDGNGLTVSGATGIHADKIVDLKGEDIKITAEGERKSGIWCENGYVDLMGEVVIETNGWYGVHADTHVSFDKGYYQISGPENNAQAVKAGSFLYMDATLEIVDPKYGHVNGNEIYGNGDSPAMELEMYSAIPEVSLYIDLPREGKLPTRNASGIYFLDPRCTVEEIVWYEDGVELVSQDAVFRAGHSYTVRIFISADDPYRFLGDVMGKVNDKAVSTGLTDRKIMRLTADLGECPVAIRSVDLEIRSPEEGKAPSTAVTAGSSAYGVYGRNVRWGVSIDGVNFMPMADGEKFVGGKYYRVFMDVTLAGNDYKFPTTTADGTLQPDVVSTVNGSPAVTEKAYDQDPQTVITVYFDFGKCNDYIIEEIDIVDVVAPVAGQHPTYTANMFGTGYHIDTTKNSYYDAYWVGEKWYYIKNGVSWWDVTDGGYDYVYENDVFLPGHEYRCQIYVVTEDGYEFVNNPYTAVWPTATINGNSATIKTEGSGLIWEQQISYTFTCEETVVNRIVVDGINFPKEGQAPDYSPILDNTGLYTLDTDYGLNGSGIYWYDCEGRQLEAGEVFGDAGPYRMAIKFVPVYENGVPLCGFAYDADVMINGKYVTPYGDWDNVVACADDVWAFYTFKGNASAPEAEQTYTLSGNISVSGATVTLLRGGDVVSTLTAGTTYSIENLAVGVYTLQVSKDGYETAEYSIVIATNTVQDVTLTAIVPAAKPGDINSDGRVNNRDLGRLQQYLNDWDVTIDTDAADVDGNGKINNRDLGRLQQYLNDWDVEI